MSVEKRRRAAALADEHSRALAEVRELRKELRTSIRSQQLAQARADQIKASHDRTLLVKAMAEGSYIEFPEDEPALGIQAGEIFQKRAGKLVKVRTFAGMPVLGGTSNRGRPSPLDFNRHTGEAS